MNFAIRRIAYAVLALTSTISTVSHADPGQFYLAPGVQWMNFDNGTMLDNDWGFSAGLGFQMTERFSVELGTFDLDPDLQPDSEIDLDHYRVDGIYDFGNALGAWQPFVVAGLGNTKFDGDNDSILNIGAGLKLQLSDNVEWRTAIRRFQYLGRDLEDIDYGIDSALVFYFGRGNERRSSAPAVARSEPRPSTPPATTPRTTTPSEPVVRDSDRDGVPDSGDACAETPMNYAVDDRGCPIPVDGTSRIELLVNFDFDRSEVKPEYFSEIEEITDFMEQNPDVVIELEGHTDSRGSEQYNLGLSERRANAVRQVMVDRFGISAGRITARGFGESQPVASNETDAGRAQNRRVITVIIQSLQSFERR
jgi:OOP family OmpA-OmpF porin